jgi:hypothetical protein
MMLDRFAGCGMVLQSIHAIIVVSLIQFIMNVLFGGSQTHTHFIMDGKLKTRVPQHNSVFQDMMQIQMVGVFHPPSPQIVSVIIIFVKHPHLAHPILETNRHSLQIQQTQQVPTLVAVTYLQQHAQQMRVLDAQLT